VPFGVLAATGSGVRRVSKNNVRSHGVARLVGSAVVLAALVGGSVRAEVPGALLPPPTDLTQPQAPLMTPSEPLVIRPQAGGVAPAGAENIQVKVADITLDGVTAYAPGALDGLFRPLVGRTIALSQLFEAARRIEARYRRDGYLLTRVVVPEQSVADGRFHIRVVEGYVAEVQITGDAGDALPLVRRYLDKITQHRPARLRDVERYLLLANDLPGISAKAVLTTDPDNLGAARLVVAVTRKAVDAFATVNNHGSVFAGPETGSVGLSLNAVGPMAGRVAGTYFTTFNDEQQYGEIQISGHVGDEGATLRAWANDSPSHPGSIFKPADIDSLSIVFGAGANYPVIRSRRIDLSLDADFEATEDTTRVLGVLVSRDVARIVRLGVSGDYHDDWQGVTSATLTYSQGLDLPGASHDGGSVPQSRLGGRSDFSKVTLQVSRLQPLYQAGPTSLALQVSAAAQYAGDRLLALEQFQIGGEQYGRDYNPGQLAGDNGAGIDAELQLTGLNPIGPVSRHQLYVFYDAAAVRDRDTPGPWSALASYGAGVRADIGPHLSGQLEVAVPYSPGRLNGAVHDRGAEVLFSLTARY
jgi:hemolysin activation/secretion protein